MARKVGVHVTSTDQKSDILQKLIAPLGHYSMMRDLPGDVISSYIGPGLDTGSLANLSLASRENRELLENELHRRGIHDLEYAEATDPNGDKVYQMGLKSYKGPDYEERFFIDIKKGTAANYNPIKLNGIKMNHGLRNGVKEIQDFQLLMRE